MNIIIRQIPDRHIEDIFDDLLNEQKLKFYAVDVAEQLGFSSFEALSQAVERAMQVCRVLNLPMEQHFKVIYKNTSKGVLCDWKISQLGKALMCINGETDNAKVAKMQVELIGRMLGTGVEKT